MHPNTRARLRRRSGILAAFAMVALLLASTTAQAAPVAWPTAWTEYAFADGSPIADIGTDNNPGYSDVWSGASGASGPLPSTYWSTDGTNIFFRIRIAADPEVTRGGSFQSSVWLAQIGVNGTHEATIGLNGKPAGTNDTVYVSNPGGTLQAVVYEPVAPDGGLSGGGRVQPDGTGAYFVDWQVPISAITAVAPTVTPSAPVQLFLGTSTNNSNINKDWMIGSTVSFDGLAVIALDGTDVSDTTTSVAVVGPTATNDSTPTITGTGEPGATVVVDVDGQTLTTTVDGTGSWSATVSTALTDGSYTVTATATDPVGNTATATGSMTIDTTTSVAVVGPTATNDSTPTITGTGEPGATVVVDVDGQTLTTTVDGTGSWSATVSTALTDGSYTVTATATDPVGNTATATGSMTIDTTTVVAITSPTTQANALPTISGTGEPGATVVVDVDGQTLTTTVDGTGSWSATVSTALTDGSYTVTATATDALGNTATSTRTLVVDAATDLTITSGTSTVDDTPTISGTGEPGATIVLTIGGQTLTTTVDGTGVWSVTVPVTLADGPYAVSAAATDLAGNTATTSQALTVDTSTVVAVTEPATSTDPTPAMNGTGEPGATVWVTVDGQTLTTTVDDTGNWSVTVPVPLDDGSYTVAATALDLSGNVAIDTHTMTIDTSTTITLTSPALTTDATPTITGTGEPGAAISVTVGGQTLTTTVDGTGHWSVTVPVALADATYPVSLTATDDAGNTATVAQNVTVDTNTSVAITSPTSTTDATPVITGTGEPGAAISVTIGGQTLTTTVDGTGHWSVAVPVALADATYPVSVTATDLAGNVATTSQSLTVNATTFVTVTSPSLTNDNTPTITGTAEPATTIDVTIGALTLTTTADGAGNWSVTFTAALADGNLLVPVTATATDGSGNTASIDHSLTVDTITTVALTSADETDDPTPVISGTGEPGATVVVNIGGQTLTATVDGAGSWSLPVPSALADATYPVSVTSTDLAGNTASTSQDLTVDTRTFVALAGPAYTNDETPTISGAGEPGSTIVVSVDGQTMTTTVDGSGAWSVSVPTALAQGSHPVTVTATDALGNTAATTQNLTVDTMTAVSIDTPTTVDDPTPTLSGTAEAGAAVVVTVDGNTLTTTADGSGNWSVTVPTALADATYPVSVTSTDLAGNTASTSQNLTVDATTFVTMTSPTLTSDDTPAIAGTSEPGDAIVVTIDGQTLTTTVDGSGNWSVTVPAALADATYPVSVTATDPSGNVATTTQDLVVDTVTVVALSSPTHTNDDTPTIAGLAEPGATVVVTVDGNTLTTTADGSGNWSVTVPTALADATYPVSVTSTDLAGNTASTSQNLTVDATTFVTMTSPTLTSDDTPAIAGTGEPGDAIVVTIDGQTLTTTVDGSGNWSVTVPAALADATYPVSVTATDPSGNVATTTQDLVVDTVTVVALSSPTHTNDDTPTIAGLAEPGATVVVTVDGNTLTTTADGSGNWSVTVPTALADATYPVSVTSTDLAGNTASTSQNLTVDATTFVTMTSPTLTSDDTPAIAGTGEPGDAIVVTIDGQTLTTTVDGSGNWSVTVPAALPEGDHTVTVVTTDALGNTASLSEALTVDLSTEVNIISAPATDDSTPTIVGTGESGSTIVLVVDGQELTTTVDGSGSWSATVPVALADDEYVVAVTSTDAAGNTATTVESLTIDTVADVEVTSLAPTNDTTPTIVGTAEPGSTVVVEVDGQTLTTTTDATGEWFVVVDVLDDGSYTATITVSDPLGNVTVETAELTIDTVVDAPTVTIDETTNDATPTITGTGEPGGEITVLIGDFTITDMVDEDGNWSVTVPEELEPGDYSVVVTIVDEAGNAETTILGLTLLGNVPETLPFDDSNLPATGLDPRGRLWFAVVMLLVGLAGVFGERRLRGLHAG